MFRIAAYMLFGFGVLSLQADENLITQGKTLFQTKICFTCHQVDPDVPAPAGMALKAPTFLGDFWGKEREVHKGLGGPIIKVKLDDEYFIESLKKPLDKVVKGALAPICLLYTSPSPRDATLSRMPSSA